MIKQFKSLSQFECFIKNAIAFFNKMYRKTFRCRLLDTILNSKAVAILFKIIRRDEVFFITIKWY